MASTRFSKTVQVIITLGLLGTAGYVLYPHIASLLSEPCKEPTAYVIASIDKRFGISEAELTRALADAETLWEDAAGRDLFTAAGGGILISLVYGDEQRTNEIGASIDAEQVAYDAKKEELEGLKDVYNETRDAYEAAAAAFDRRAAAYHADVEMWNQKGGAPPSEYERLKQEQVKLEEERDDLNDRAEEVNAAAASLNEAVDELNTLAKKLNTKVANYNERAGDPFDQGDYVADAQGERISVYEFSDGTDLRRVLAHEFGHALGIDHVEDPSSIMYSFNAGSKLVLSEDDVAALVSVCDIK